MAPNLDPGTTTEDRRRARGRARAAIVRYVKQQATRQAAEPGGAARAAALSELALLVERQPASELLTGTLAVMHDATGSDIYAPGERATRVLAAYGTRPLPPAGSLAREALDGEFLGSWLRAAIKDSEEVDVVAQARERMAQRRSPDNYSGPEAV
jgi:hypothetical protein